MPDLKLGFARASLEKELSKPNLSPKVRQRIRFVLLWDSGATLGMLASDLGMTERTASRWKQRWQELTDEGVQGLARFLNEGRSPGRPARAKEQFLAAMARVPPDEPLDSIRLAQRIGMPERTVRRFLASMRRPPQKPVLTP
jgi:hypothetical protein